MLELLRRDASMVVSKILLGFIVLVFVLYFGFNFTRKSRGMGQGPGSPVARVNGLTIPAGVFSQDVQNQMSLYRQFNQGQLPPDTEKMVQGQILQKLIRESLLAEEAHRLGLRVPDQEVAAEIVNNPSFRKNGQFNESYYLDQFKTYYERQYGQNYEYSLRQDILVEKLKDALEGAALVSNQQVQDSYLLKETKLKLRRLSIPFKENGEPSEAKAVEWARQWMVAVGENKPTAEVLKASEVKEETLEGKSLQELQILFGVEDSLPILSCLLQAKAGQVCEEPYQVKQTVIAVQLLERIDAPPAPEKKDAMGPQLLRAKQIQVLNAAADYLTKKAKVETYLTK